MKKTKYYVVWSGKKPGIYTDWNTCKAQIDQVKEAKYKSFETQREAEEAFKIGPESYLKPVRKTTAKPVKTIAKGDFIKNSLSVDAACSGNPGIMEFRGVDVATGREIFRFGPYDQGTNNIGEFLALVYGLKLLKDKGLGKMPIYTDSKTAMSWVKLKAVKTTLKQTAKNKVIFDQITRALNWLKTNTYETPILKWETEIWGEIPADFGRK